MNNGVRAWAKLEPERIALLFPDGAALTYLALEASANRFAHLFEACGLSHGDHVAVLLGNDAEIVALCWAASRAGVYLTPVPNSLSAFETAYIVENCAAKLVIASARYATAAAHLSQLANQPRLLALGGHIPGFENLEQILAATPARPRNEEMPGALMMYSSGTTGKPKGIWRKLPERSAVTDGPPTFARDLISLFGMDASTRYLSTAPLYHAAPLRFALAVTAAGGTVVVMDRFDAAAALDLIEKHQITMSQWVPTMFQRLLALPRSRRGSFKACCHSKAVHGAAPCTPTLKRAMIDWWGPILDEYYSGSEGVGLTLIDSTEWLAKPGSVGRSRKGDIHILDEGDAELPPGGIGRIFFGGGPPFEYFFDPAKTASRSSRQGYQTFGDVGYVDEDGYLFLCDRLDDMIITGGVNVYPQEIESALEEVEGVQECGVVGFPDEEFQERPVAFIVPSPAHKYSLAKLATAIEAHMESRLGRIKRPREVRFQDELPRSPTGKLLRRELRRPS